MELILGAIVSYLVGLAVNLRSDALIDAPRRELEEKLAQEEALRRAIASGRNLREELASACIDLAKDRRRRKVTPQEEKLLTLLADPVFQDGLYRWFVAGGIQEGAAAKEELWTLLSQTMAWSGLPQVEVENLQERFFQTLERALFGHDILARWRHQLSLEYLTGLVEELRQQAAEAAGIYSSERQRAVLERYVEKALTTWDIIDLANLPVEDAHIATKRLLLRQLYMPLRIECEPVQKGGEDNIADFEQERAARRRREAGHDLSGAEGAGARKGRVKGPVGKHLQRSQRLVVLGDPGGGKTTLLRWLATAYLLRRQGSEDSKRIPDIKTLPARTWIPVLIRCRDLGEDDLSRDFVTILTQHLYKGELPHDDAKVMCSVILDRIARGEVLLLVDGLDEISQVQVRQRFSQELERTSRRYPEAPIIVTSRIVGYRDMPYRMGSGFLHGVIADLEEKDKEAFAEQWVEVTDQHLPEVERAARIKDLKEALASGDRIQRLTANPMLLTTLALVKRKVGRLPQRRAELYREAVSVLLNWNPLYHEVIDAEEAIPQLEYLAYAMCDQGEQRLKEEKILDLLEQVRQEYPYRRALNRHKPEEFLQLLERRSSLLIRSGSVLEKDRGREQPTWEFRHLTFQEYLAARALLDGRYPNRDRSLTLAQQVAPLAGRVQERSIGREKEPSPHDAWREALRLLVAEAGDDDVNAVLTAILIPLLGEDPTQTGRARAVLAAFCLADEPNVSEETGRAVLEALAAQVDGRDGKGYVYSLVDQAALAVGGSPIWQPHLKETLLMAFVSRLPTERWNPGGLWGMVGGGQLKEDLSSAWVEERVERLQSQQRLERIAAALEIMDVAFRDRIPKEDNALVVPLLGLLEGGDDPPAQCAAVSALGCMAGRNQSVFQNLLDGGVDLPPRAVVRRLGAVLTNLPQDEVRTKYWLAVVLGRSRESLALPHLLPLLETEGCDVRKAATEALGKLGAKEAVPALMEKLNDKYFFIRQAAIEALVKIEGDKVDGKLLSRDIDGRDPWLDPREPVTRVHMAWAAKRLKLTEEEVRERFERLAKSYNLTLEWASASPKPATATPRKPRRTGAAGKA